MRRFPPPWTVEALDGDFKDLEPPLISKPLHLMEKLLKHESNSQSSDPRTASNQIE
jgi:hypothetical protein